ncbi:MAG: hypothetical protein GC162_15245 [Planctomycetes bacterium]|nr:hypothetical protein [Planctomycetota bacterium]
MPKAAPSIAELTFAYLERDIAPESLADLRERLAADSAARRTFILTCLQSRLLVDRFNERTDQTLRREAPLPSAKLKAGSAGVGLPQATSASPHADAEPAPGRSVWYTKGFRVQGSGFSFKAAIAALILLAAALLYVFLPTAPNSPLPAPHSAAPASFAILSDRSDDAQFADADLSLGEGLNTPIKLTAGRAQVMFKSTAVVDLTGPCEFAMTGPNRGRLASGKLEAYCRPEARGFTVDLPDGSRIVDLGTAFVLQIDPVGNAFVQVTEGHVRLEGRADKPIELAAGQRGTIDRFGRATDTDQLADDHLAGVYDFESAQASPRGVPLDQPNGNDGWKRVGGTGQNHTMRVRNDHPPDANFKGNYLDARADNAGDEMYVRPADAAFAPRIASDAQVVSVSFIVNQAEDPLAQAFVGIGSPGAGHIRFGMTHLNQWTVRNTDETFAFEAPGPGPARIDRQPRTYRATLNIFINHDNPAQTTASLRVENLTDGGSTFVASRIALPLSAAAADPSKWTSLSARVRRAAVDDIVIGYTLAPPSDRSEPTSKAPADRHREATARGPLPKEVPFGEK